MELTAQHLAEILPRLRERDVVEILAASRYPNLEAWAASRLELPGSAWAVIENGIPMWCGGVLEGAVRGIGAMWLVGAKGCEPFVMYACRVWQAVVDHGGFRRLECKCYADNEPANRFAKIVGLAYEGTLRGFTLDGKDLNQYGMVIGGANGR